MNEVDYKAMLRELCFRISKIEPGSDHAWWILYSKTNEERQFESEGMDREFLRRLLTALDARVEIAELNLLEIPDGIEYKDEYKKSLSILEELEYGKKVTE
jgi:hypothetical protein